jgi:hypothetical protein
LKTLAKAAFGLTTLTALLLVLPQASQSSQPININSCTTINSPGHYRLAADLTFNPGPAGLPSSSTCITIGASNVDLDLNGHTITGPGGGADGTAGSCCFVDYWFGITLVSELPATSQPVVIGFNSETNKTETNLSRNRT